ncbi:MAG: rhodanese-like domain-containing protein [Alphaproteobacteria bacterium]
MNSRNIPIPVHDLMAWLGAPGELAVLDVREEGVFANGHMLWASNVPLSRLELLIRDLVPRLSASLVLCDDGDGLAPRAAARLESFGYDDVKILEGGVQAWAQAGFELFSGLNVPSKAFGEFIEEECGTPHIAAAELKRRLDAGEDLIILDARPMNEFNRMNIPGAIDCPGAELAYRIQDLAPSPETRIVVNCAGRTRSIIGAQTLINSGVSNQVSALENGTMGWHLTGYELEHGQDRPPPAVSDEGLIIARARARDMAARFGVKAIDRATLAQWRAECDRRTLYVFDVRGPDEFEAGHLPGAVPAQGVQLVQRTEAFIAVRGARIVLVDDTGVRAMVTASWLVQMGFDDIHVLEPGIGDGDGLETGPHHPLIPGQGDTDAATITPQELRAVAEQDGVVVIDFARSLDYGAGHIPGAWFAIRARLGDSFANIPDACMLVLTSDNGTLARLAAADVQGLTTAAVKVLDGGTQAWRGAGYALQDGLTNLADKTDDAFWRPYERSAGAEAAMTAYLDWELGLMEQIARDGTARFRTFPR